MSRACVCALVAAGFLLPARAADGPPVPAPAPEPVLSMARVVAESIALREMEADLSRDLTRLESLKRNPNPTTAQRRELVGLESRVQEMAARFQVARTRLRAAEQAALRHQPLWMTLDIRLENATLGQTAAVVARATGMEVLVDDQIPENRRLTVTARGVRAGQFLENLAKQADLMIEPSGKGVRLRPWPVREVQGRLEPLRSRIAPWSEVWGAPPLQEPPSLVLQVLPDHTRLVGARLLPTGRPEPPDSLPGELFTASRHGEPARWLGTDLPWRSAYAAEPGVAFGIAPRGGTGLAVGYLSLSEDGKNPMRRVTFYEWDGSILRKAESRTTPAPLQQIEVEVRSMRLREDETVPPSRTRPGKGK